MGYESKPGRCSYLRKPLVDDAVGMSDMKEIHSGFCKKAVLYQPAQVRQHELIFVVFPRVISLDEENGRKGPLCIEDLRQRADMSVTLTD